MDSDKINRWLTLGANLGVLVGIILILIELNQNAELMRAQMTQARSDAVVASYRDQQHSPYWAQIRAKRRGAKSAQEWIESLTPEEYERVFYHHLAEYHSIRTQYVQYHAGYLDESIWNSSTRGQIIRLAETWPFFFEGRRGEISREFADYLDSVAQEEGLPNFFRSD